MTKIPWHYRLIVVLLGLAAFGPTLKVGFLWSDHRLIEKNESLTDWRLETLVKDWTEPFAKTRVSEVYRPFVPFFNRLDRMVWGTNPFGFHLTNLLIHLATALLFLQLAWVLTRENAQTALIAACLFVVHPAIIQSFLVVMGRDELLSCFFMFACLLLLREPGILRSVLGIICFGLCVLSKETGIITVLLAAMLLFYEDLDADESRLKESAPMFFALAILAAFFVIVHGQALPSYDEKSTDIPNFWKAGIPWTLGHYLRSVVWPVPLYADPLFRVPDGVGLFAWGSLLGITGWIAYQRNPFTLFCAAWFVLVLVVRIPAMAANDLRPDHAVYPALFGVLVWIASGLSTLGAHPRAWVRGPVRVATALFVVFFIYTAHYHVWVRSNEEAFFRWSLQYPTSDTMSIRLNDLISH